MTQKPAPFSRQVLIPTEGSPEAVAAARMGLRLARALGASVRAVSVVDRQIVYGPGTLAAARIRPGLQAELEKDAHSAVAAVAREARRLGAAVLDGRAGRPGPGHYLGRGGGPLRRPPRLGHPRPHRAEAPRPGQRRRPDRS